MLNVDFSRASTVILLLAGGISATALALGSLSPITKDQGVSYVDADYLGGQAIVSAVDRTAGSGSESLFEIQVKLPAGAGSLTEDAYFVGTLKSSEKLPAAVSLTPANDRFEVVTDRPAGDLGINQFDSKALKGELFGYEVDALPQTNN